MTLIHDKHNGWQKLCNDCNEGRVEFHTTSYFGGSRDCDECDGAGGWDADLDDFDSEVVRLKDGAVGMIVCIGTNVWLIDADDNEHDAPDVDDIAAVLESELA